LEWAKLGESRRQIDDVTSLLRVRGPELDRAYLAGWIRQLGLVKEWSMAAGAAGLP
jgi:hypothetical protein